MVCLSLVMACSRRNGMEGTLERAGKNRAELEKVLEHYAGDELKYKAACYLIEHMENCYFYADPGLIPEEPEMDGYGISRRPVAGFGEKGMESFFL